MHVLFLLLFWLFFEANQPAFAGTMEGKCFEKTKANFDNKTIQGWVFKCNKGSWTSAGNAADTADANGFMEIYADEGKSPDASVELKFRPRRSSECLISIHDRTLMRTITQHACDTAYKSAVTMAIDKRGNGWATVAGAVATTSKQHAFSIMYMQGLSLGIPNDTDYYLVAAFIEANQAAKSGPGSGR